MDGEAAAAPPAPPGDGAAWWSLFGALHVNVAVAPVFAFGVMAPSFGRLAGSSPGGTAAIGVAANAGLWLNVVPGYAATPAALLRDGRGARRRLPQACFGLSGVAFAQLYDACLFGTVDAAGACAGGWFGGELLPFLGLAARARQRRRR
ncbi:hypothetical protein JL722_2723 [Aureococcus anophagefferens]|nr:hypothetical protein JL722_2723 [Aureococcus anophagefferens]